MKNIDRIFEYIKSKQEKVQFKELKNKFDDINESTLVRNLNKLIKENKLKKEKDWKNIFYFIFWKEFIIDYLSKPFFEREAKKYNKNFLKNYIPNKTSFLWDRQIDILEKLNSQKQLSTYDYKNNIKAIENLLIDLSYTSSKLEWNTYSYLDTEVLIKYNEKAEGKTQQEYQMILNHKNVIKYIIENKNKIIFDKKTFFEIHQILWEWLLLVDYLWNIRKGEVQIWWSPYKPLDNYYLLNEEFELFLEKLNSIKNPFEQALFILVFIPYFQIFMDINKRTSRITCNIPLIKNWLPPLSLLQTKEKDYILAVLAIYELNDISLMRDLFVDNYLLNFERYI